MDQKQFQAAIRADPHNEELRAAYGAWIEAQWPGVALNWDVEELRAGKIPLSDDDFAAIKALCRVSFIPASWPKRFIRNIAGQVENGKVSLTPKQHAALWQMVFHFRRQIDTRIVALCPERKPRVLRNIKAIDGAAPAFRQWAEKNL